MPGMSFLTRQGPSPHTHSVLSQKHKIYSSSGGGSTPIGVVSTFTQTQGRNVEPVRGIGFGDVIAELVPQVADPPTLTVERTALYVSFLMEVFGYIAMSSGLVRALSHHRWPFDVKSEVLFSQLGDENVTGGGTVGGSSCGHQCIITFFEGAWFTNYNVSYPVDAAIITESCDISCTQITDGHSAYGACISTGNESGSRIFG